MKNFYGRLLPACLFLFGMLCLAGNALAQVNAPINAVETQSGVFDFSTTYTGGSGSAYAWNFGDGNQGSGNPVTHAYSFPGTYAVQLQVYDTASSTVEAAGNYSVTVTATTCDISPAFNATPTGFGYVLFSDASTSASGNITGLHWNFGDGQTADNTPTPQHQYAANGNYTVCLTVYDDLGCTDTVCNTVNVTTVNCNMSVSFTATTDTNGLVVTNATVTGGTPPYAYTWNFQGGAPATSNDGPTSATSFTISGLYQICLGVTDANSCFAGSCEAVTVNVGGTGPCQPGFGDVSFYNVDSMVYFQVSAPQLAWPNTVVVDFGDGQLGTYQFNSSLTIAHPYPTSNATYNPCFYITNGNNCLDTVCLTVFSPCWGLNGAFTYNLDPNNMATFISTATGGTAPYQYFWDFGDGGQGTGSNPAHFYNAPGQYNVCLTVMDANGCSTSTCNGLVVPGGCAQNFTSLNYSVTANGVNFTLTPNAGTMPYTVQVDFGDGNTIPPPGLTMTSVLSLPHTYTTPGIYTPCFITTDANGCTDTICTDVNSGCPTFATTFIAQNMANGQVQLNAVTTGGTPPYTYDWSPSNTLNTATGATVVATPAGPTTYCVYVTDANGCMSSFCGAVQPPCNLDVTFTYTLSGNMMNAQVNNPTAGAFYAWIINNNTYTGTSITASFTSFGDQVVCIQASSGQCTNYGCDTVPYTLSNADTLSGYLWNDANGNGLWDSGEVPLPQSLVTICHPNDTMSCQYAYTGANGYYQFIVAPGEYEISSFSWISTYVQTFPVSPTVYSVTTTGNSNIEGFNFGYQSQSVTITGCVFYDTNNNGVQDSGEQGAAYQYVQLGGWWFYTNATGCYTATMPPGTYTVSYDISQNVLFAFSTPSSYSVAATSIGQTYSGYDFGLWADPTMQNVCVNITPYTTVTPGFPAWYYIKYCNYGAMPASGSVTYTWNPFLSVDAFTPAPDNISGNTATWNFTGLGAGQCVTIFADFDAPTSLPLSTPITSGATVTLSSGTDVFPANNVDTTHQIVVGSWDPNAKEVMPAGEGDDGFIHPDLASKLTYTVHFQNTGTAPAVNVVLIDTLSPNLDWNTFRMLSASHEYVTAYDPGTGIVKWYFNNIMLPDSGADYQGSMGFVEFEIESDDALPQSSQIKNFADIYFDFNEAVRTNTVTNTIRYGLHANGLVAAIGVSVVPNPAKDYVQFSVTGLEKPEFSLVIRNALGQKMRDLSSNGQKITLMRENLASGIYSYEILSNATHVARGTFVLD